jgi:hypothetical protein
MSTNLERLGKCIIANNGFSNDQARTIKVTNIRRIKPAQRPASCSHARVSQESVLDIISSSLGSLGSLIASRVPLEFKMKALSCDGVDYTTGMSKVWREGYQILFANGILQLNQCKRRQINNLPCLVQVNTASHNVLKEDCINHVTVIAGSAL